jgi:hypothetical protein
VADEAATAGGGISSGSAEEEVTDSADEAATAGGRVSSGSAEEEEAAGTGEAVVCSSEGLAFSEDISGETHALPSPR